MLPKQILIGNIPYKIKVVEGLVKDGNKEYWGQIEYLKQVITMSDQLETEAFAKILLHEITHGILQEYGMSKHNKEDFVDRLTAALYDFLTRNDLSFLRPEKITKHDDSLDAFQYAAKKLASESTMTMPAAASLVTNRDNLEEAMGKVDWVVPLNGRTKEKQKPRQLPVINPGSSTFSLSELATIKKQEEPDFWKTGIKIKDDEKCFKTRYVCPECGNKGTRYLPEDYQYVICHDCDEEIQKIPATIEGFPHRDTWGNYFIAGEVQQYGSEKA